MNHPGNAQGPGVVPARDARLMTAYFYAVCGFIFLKLIQDQLAGGDVWKQGDWLISSELVNVRRGLLGLGILVFSDTFHFSAMSAVIIFQGMLLMILVWGLHRLLWHSGEHGSIFSVLILSPVFVLMFWGNDPLGSLRKELLVYAAHALLLVPLTKNGRGTCLFALAASGLMTLGVLGHEVNAVMLCSFLLCLYWVLGGTRRRLFWILAAALAAFSAWALFYHFGHARLASVQAVCIPLTSRGISPGMCGGSMAWLVVTPGDAHQKVLLEVARPQFLYFVATYVGATALVLYLNGRFDRASRLHLLYFLLLVPFLPLYFVAVDFGRWLVMHMASYTFCLMAMCLGGGIQIVRPLSQRFATCMVVASPFLSPLHTSGRSDARVMLPILAGLAVIFMVHRFKVWRFQNPRATEFFK
jgi:hypothetical protein